MPPTSAVYSGECKMSGKSLLLFFFAGGLGTLSRFGLSNLINRASGFQYPLGTLAVNGLGCFIFGFFWVLSEHLGLDSRIRVIIMSGFLGAFTTFSSMIFESDALTVYSLFSAFLNVAVQLVAGFSLFHLGAKLSRFLLG